MHIYYLYLLLEPEPLHERRSTFCRYSPLFGSHHSDKVKKEEQQQGPFDTRSSIQSYCDKNILASTMGSCNIVPDPKNYGNYTNKNKHNSNRTT